MRNHYKYNFIVLLIVAVSVISSCKKFVELGPPPTQTIREEVFQTDATATSAILGMYTGQPLPTLLLPLTVLPGMSADDIKYSTTDVTYDEFKNNAITNINSSVGTVWYYAYMHIKNANYAISGLNGSTTLTPSVKNQLLGEAKFQRAFAYFYLVNLYGDVPLALSDDAIANASLPRESAVKVWAQIITDLKEAQALLPAVYVGTFRARINKYAATALLARAYLYTKDYVSAEAQATQVISSGMYSLQAPASAFINTSNEIIWQIANTTGVSTYGANFLPATGAVPTFSMYDTLYRSFEAGDLRKTAWTGVATVSGVNYYYVSKYKVRITSGNEYNVALRYAEMYLIRSEARAQQNNLTGAKADVDAIRNRAGLSPLSSTLTQVQILLAIEQERKVELFAEWGHRWLDLKRTGRADTVIGGQKPATWKPTAVLYPIPFAQIQANVSLTQNPGYN